MSIQQLITPEKHDLGGFSVQRILPDWQDHRFPAVPGETEFIPLPDNSDHGSSAIPLS